MFVKMTFFGELSAVKFIDGRVKSAVGGEQIKNVGFEGFFGTARTKWCDIDIFGGVLTEAFVVNTADGERGIVGISI